MNVDETNRYYGGNISTKNGRLNIFQLMIFWYLLQWRALKALVRTHSIVGAFAAYIHNITLYSMIMPFDAFEISCI